jgi:hypothetical protein
LRREDFCAARSRRIFRSSVIKENFVGGNKSPRRPLSSSEAAEDRHGGAIAAWRYDYIKRRMKMLNMRNAAIAVITSASLSLLAVSVAQAQGGEKPTHEKMPTHRAIYNTTRDPSTINRRTPTWLDNYHGMPTLSESGGVG